ncbi:conserved hypothetical protein [Ricinus communis]|uniref:Uncharacterized protein n=1 Tax=Ricinus communis TaxID=3988 RepID=B9RNX4_RICCO|nr:conserved hypothetical protein [Ricinus communis]
MREVQQCCIFLMIHLLLVNLVWSFFQQYGVKSMRSMSPSGTCKYRRGSGGQNCGNGVLNAVAPGIKWGKQALISLMIYLHTIYKTSPIDLGDLNCHISFLFLSRTEITEAGRTWNGVIKTTRLALTFSVMGCTFYG